MSNPIIWIVMPRTGTFTYSFHPSTYGTTAPSGHMTSFKRHLHSSLLQLVSYNLIFLGSVMHPSGRRPVTLLLVFLLIFLWNFPWRTFFLRSFLLPFLGKLTTDMDHCSSWKARSTKSQNFMKPEGRVITVFTRTSHLSLSWER